MSGVSVEGSRKYRVIGGLLTLVWAAMIVGYLVVKDINPLLLKPNEFGDFLAGILGPLGILWIVLGFWQQGDELRGSVKALNLQSEELRNSVEQQKALVEVTRAQVEAQLAALADETKHRRLGISPSIRVSAAGGMRTGEKFTSNILITNIGAGCSDLKIWDNDSREVKLIGEKATLDSGEQHKVSIKHGREDHQQFRIDISYRLKDGSSGRNRYKLIRVGPDTVGFTVTDIEDTMSEN